ncbi:MAG: CotH kinase family protein [Rhodothermales bacterium]
MKSLTLLLLFLAATAMPASAQGVVVNEVLASNQATLADPDFSDFGDWFELYNASQQTVDLGGAFLTDDLDEPMQWRIPDGTTLAAGAFLIVWADDGDTSATALHTNFKLSAGGEQVGLFDASGAVIDTVSFGEQTTDISYGRYPDGSDTFALFAVPTPEAPNDTDPGGDIAEPPTFSLASGFYDGTESIEIAAEADATVRYTLDGTEPTESSPAYTSPLALSQTTVIRAAAFAPERAPSEVVSRAYFVGESSVLPVVSLVTDPAGFFSDEAGIYVEGTNGIPGRCRTDPVNWNQDWEREVHLSFFEPDGVGGHTLALEQGAGVQIFGGCSRIYPQKSLSLHARSQYGASDFAYRFFEDVDIESFDDLVLRSSAQDWWRTMFRDGMIQTLTRHMDIDGQAYRPTIVFLNGEYWGIHNLREKLNEDYVAGHYGIDDDSVELIEGTWGGQSEHYDALDDLLAGDLNTPDVFAQVEARMDVDEYLSYLVAEIYSANADWPGNNLKLWRPMTPEGRWRWMFFDTDFGFGGNANGQYDSNTLALATEPNGPGWPNPPWSTYLFRRLLTHDGFRHGFIQRMAAHANTTFDPQRTLALIDSLQTNIAPEIPRHKTRWPQSISFGPSWDALVGIMRDFATARPQAVRSHVTGYFDEVVGSARLTLTTTAGGRVYAEGVPMASLRLNGLPEATGGVFEPIFYRGVPLELAAVPDEGYRFTGWSGLVDASADTISVVLTESASLTATFALATATEALGPPASAQLAVYPNLTARTATVEATLAHPGDLSVRVMDLLGREVVVLSRGPAEAGTHRLAVDASTLSSGVYFVVMTTDGFRAMRRLVVTR